MTKENMSNEKTAKTATSPEKIIYILDTNILLHEPFAFLSLIMLWIPNSSAITLLAILASDSDTLPR